MKKNPIYVQISIQTDMDRLWRYTQDPELHQQWDLRFTDITYLKRRPGERQRFLYETRIGFGLKISGTGESTGSMYKETGDRVSSLSFASSHPLSLIREGRGYWKYKQIKNGIAFMTQYDYETNYGRLGRLADLAFRPLIGWATAWSFDALKIWLEKGLHPKLLIQKTAIYWFVCLLLSFIWIYQGLIPKLIMQHPEEISMLSSLSGGRFPPASLLKLIGLAEMALGILWLFPVCKRKWFLPHIALLVLLTACAGMTDITSFAHPFNPVALNTALIILSIIGYVSAKEIPSARNTIRKRRSFEFHV
ncbi:DoxX-like family protein [Bacillus sp. z60-18]|uniref:DoxX-like family protein n=1 Tax=unclassified Bacillus (in: firmicutes) TaxID=185979 RepID=UPI0024096DCE|nr:DoxX-like family protein [Bacillus sp. HSf4]WFA07283.1 DoxX-like family protein [Bacillus sp. HSf4]